MNREYLTGDKRLKPCPLCKSNVKKRLNPKGNEEYSLGIGCICGFEWESDVYKYASTAAKEGIVEWNRMVDNGD